MAALLETPQQSWLLLKEVKYIPNRAFLGFVAFVNNSQPIGIGFPPMIPTLLKNQSIQLPEKCRQELPREL